MELQSGLLSRNLLEKVLPDAPKCTKMAVFGYELGYELDCCPAIMAFAKASFRSIL